MFIEEHSFIAFSSNVLDASIVSPNCVMTPQLIPCDKLYFPGVVSFHYTGDKHYVIDKDHPHHFC